jgi:flagellar biosynthesis/type III secretory pathway chaperone
MTKQIQPSMKYLKQLTELRLKTREAMLGNDPESQAELRFVESRIIEKIKEVQDALGIRSPKVVK